MNALISIACFIAGIAVGGQISNKALRSHQVHGAQPMPSPTTIRAISAVTFALVGFQTGWSMRLVPFLVLAGALVAVSIIDWCQQRIPSIIVKPAFAASVASLMFLSAVGEPGSLTLALLGSLAFSGLLGVIHLLSPAGMGMGDVRLAALLGLFVGWLSSDWMDTGWNLGFVLLLASIIGLTGVAVSAGRTRGSSATRSLLAMRHVRVPFGPALSLATGVLILGSF